MAELDNVLNKIPIVAVVGPTASGKTKLGVDIALKFNGEVVSADSMQIYQGMAIATAKPTLAEMRGVPHHLIDFLPPEQGYSVARYVEDAQASITDITSRGKLPVLVGGTGLYVDALLGGIRFAKEPGTPEIRAQLYDQAAQLGNEAMHAMLTQIDPQYAAGLHPNNLGRVLRAIELYRATGKTMSEQQKNSREKPSDYAPIMLGLNFSDRAQLYERINGRVDTMLEQGLIEEVQAFYKAHSPKTAAQAIGCKEFLGYLSGEKTLEQCTEDLKRETRRYAKRQLTWFKRNTQISWLNHDEFDSYQALLDHACRIVLDGPSRR
ncbi:tRNA (adenosine(37)-N6)-dimethylallyltransferase MiaA [Oscillospiraceae bacterium LTW-04]|nr:tRNA (adenosine(37)-N6)-dimethylallyltransferase MiaA [Oscillospiraceae bacterium MB24-C1]